MKRILLFVFVTFSALAFAACGGTAENKPANAANTANANAAKPAAPVFKNSRLFLVSIISSYYYRLISGSNRLEIGTGKRQVGHSKTLRRIE